MFLANRKRDTMKPTLCTLAAVLLVGVLSIHPADAACWWNGYGWNCWHPWHYAHWGYWHPYYHGGWGWHHWRHW
jgi:hypothetical protein